MKNSKAVESSNFEGSFVIRGATVYGWAYNKDNPDEYVVVEVFANERFIGKVKANIFRQDLHKAGKGDGDHGFIFNLTDSLNFKDKDYYISVKIEGSDFFLRKTALKYNIIPLEKDPLSIKNKFCPLPFDTLVLGEGGNVYLCCPEYLPVVIGNAYHQSLEEIWNSSVAKEVRRSIIRGNFNFCLPECPSINKKTLPDRDMVEGIYNFEKIYSNEETISLNPKHLALLHDRSCNIFCPSCRTERYMASGKELIRLSRVLNDFIRPALGSLQKLQFAGGEVLASKHLMEVMASIDKTKYPDLRIEIFTNGTLFNEDAWRKLMNIHGMNIDIYVSLDATTKETFETIRRGAKFDVVSRNLRFLSSLRVRGEISRFGILFVVQSKNFREMVDFVKMGKSLSCDYVGFSRLLPEGIYSISRGDFEKQNICSESHPEHDEFVNLLSDPIFDDPVVDLKNISVFRRKV